MKKIMMAVFFLLIIFLSGCSKNQTLEVSELSGKYYFTDCVYLNMFSSATLDYYTEQFENEAYIDFSLDQVSIFGTNREISTYTDIQWVHTKVDQDLDSVISWDMNGIFATFDERYDLYAEDESVGISLFVSGENVYIAETRMIGGSSDIFTVWTIFEIQK